MADPKIRDEDRAYETSTPEANRSIEQGNGVGARELAAQRDPSETPEHDPFKEGLDDADDGASSAEDEPRPDWL